MQAPLSSLPLQMTLFFHTYYDVAYVVVMLLMFIYKGALAAALVVVLSASSLPTPLLQWCWWRPLP